MDHLLARRAISNAPHGCRSFGGKFSVTHHACQEAFGISLFGTQHSAFDQNLQRSRAADQWQKRCQFVVGNRETQPVDRHAEARTFPGNAQITLTGQLQAAAGTGAVDHCHRRMTAFPDRAQRTEHQFAVINLALLDGIALLCKLGNVSPCSKRLAAGATQYHAAQRIVIRQTMHRCRQFAPHRDRQCVQFRGIG